MSLVCVVPLPLRSRGAARPIFLHSVEVGEGVVVIGVVVGVGYPGFGGEVAGGGIVGVGFLCIGALTGVSSTGSDLAEASGSPEPGLIPSYGLVRGLVLPVQLKLADAGISRGSKAVDFSLLDISGRKVTLSERLNVKPVVLILGSYT